jgi:hypothetical protein
MSEEDLRKELEETKKRLAAAQARAAKGLSYKVSQKGALSVYGLGKFPVTLYKEQWLRLLAVAEDIKAFMEEHSDELKTKDRSGGESA